MLGWPSEIKVPEVLVVPNHHHKLLSCGVIHSYGLLEEVIKLLVAFAAARVSGQAIVGTLPVDGKATFRHHWNIEP